MNPIMTQSYDLYIDDYVEYHPQNLAPKISVVIVAYDTNQALIQCLESLQTQTFKSFETLVIDNGKNEAVLNLLPQFSLRYFRLKENYRPSLARNVGIAHSRGRIVCLLDDDALAHSDYVQEHWNAHQQESILGVRGKIIPKTRSVYNKLALHYNLGDQVVPSYVDMENNASFPREVLLEVGGFNPEVFAGEGAELSYRITKRYGNPASLIYWPGAVVYHDFSTGWKKYYRKTLRGAKMQVYLGRLYPDFWDYVESYHPFPSVLYPAPDNFRQRVQLALLRRLGRWTRCIGIWWNRAAIPPQ
jgi:glycosyltransferase involved in cell wall biosynthesis